MTPLIEQQLEAFFRAHMPPTMVADVGAGHDGKVANALRTRYHGADAPLERFDHEQLDICRSPLPRLYDTVVSCDLLEHVLDPFAAAANIVVSVNPYDDGGMAHQFGWLYVTTVFAFEHHEYPIDMWRFTTTALEHLFEPLAIERCWYEEESPHPDFGRRWRVSLIGQRV